LTYFDAHMRRIIGAKWEELMAGWEKVYNE
jgi:hypothetical protein